MQSDFWLGNSLLTALVAIPSLHRLCTSLLQADFAAHPKSCAQLASLFGHLLPPNLRHRCPDVKARLAVRAPEPKRQPGLVIRARNSRQSAVGRETGNAGKTERSAWRGWLTPNSAVEEGT